MNPNAIWTADFKGQFRTRDRQYVYPLTVVDGYSRYLLACQGLRSTSVQLAKPVFKRLFEEYGLPSIIRTDNGVPFATTTLGRLLQVVGVVDRLGIYPELIEPAHPEQNGRHERMHRTLKAETTRPPRGNLEAQQARFNEFRREYNEDRPHEGLGQETPASVYRSSRESSRRSFRGSNTQVTSKCGWSVGTAESAGRPTGSASPTLSQKSTSASKRSMTGFGTYTLGPSSSDGWTNADSESRTTKAGGYMNNVTHVPRTKCSYLPTVQASFRECNGSRQALRLVRRRHHFGFGTVNSICFGADSDMLPAASTNERVTEHVSRISFILPSTSRARVPEHSSLRKAGGREMPLASRPDNRAGTGPLSSPTSRTVAPMAGPQPYISDFRLRHARLLDPFR